MVSQSDHYPSSTSLALRAASSAVTAAPPPLLGSSASIVGGGGVHGSRSRRYNRSHAGGTSYVPLNEFPTFSNTGDVEIVVRVRSGHENCYLLHRDTLARCSGFFEVSTSKEWTRAQTVDIKGTVGSLEDARERTLPSGDEVARVGEGGSGSSSNAGDSGMGLGSEERDKGGASILSDKTTRRRWRYELDLGQGENDKPILIQKNGDTIDSLPTAATQSIFGGGVNTNNTSSHHRVGGGAATKPGALGQAHPGFFRSVANLALSHTHQSSSRHHGNHSRTYGSPNSLLPPPPLEDIDILRDYDNLFRIMYNYPPLLDGVNIADAYVQCKSLLAVADEYDALEVVGPRVDHHLLQFQSRLWRQIAKYPISYLRLGYLARSRVIFQEAFVHVVGQWPAGERSLRAAMPLSVLDLIEDKVDELAEAVSRAESRLFRLHLTTRNGERVSPSTSYLDWLAVSLFRQWLADNTTPPASTELNPTMSQALPDIGSSNSGNNGNSGGGRARGGALVGTASGPSSRRGGHGTGPGTETVTSNDRHGHRGSHGSNGGSNHSRSQQPQGHGHGSSSNGYQHIRGSRGTNGGRPSTSSSSSNEYSYSMRETALMLHVRTTTVPPLTPPLSSLGRTYRTLGTAAGPSYLSHDECKRFLKMTPDLYSRDNLRRFEKRIDELKAMTREIVRPLMGSGLELDMGRSGGVHGGGTGSNENISYFTCTYLCERDLPWYVEGL